MKKLIITLSAIIFFVLSCKKDNTEEAVIAKPTKCLPVYKIDSLHIYENAWVVEYITYEYNSKKQLTKISVQLHEGGFISDLYELVYDENDRLSEVIRDRGKFENTYYKWILQYNDENQLINNYTQVIVDEESSGDSVLRVTYEYLNKNSVYRFYHDGIYSSQQLYELDENRNVAFSYYYDDPEKLLNSEYEFFYSDKMQAYSNWSFDEQLLFRKDLSINQYDSLIWTVHNNDGSTEEPALSKPRPGEWEYNELGYLTRKPFVVYEYMYY